MIVLFTDYGLHGPYTGQIEAVLHEQACQEKVINLFANAPRYNAKASAYLLAAYSRGFREGCIFFCVVDPGVGGKIDTPVILKIDGRWYVGPDNGLFDIVARRASELSCWEISWPSEKLSNSFHGRDVYAPVCAMLANAEQPPAGKIKWKDRHSWPDDLHEIVYIDHFGNCVTGIRAGRLKHNTVIELAGVQIEAAKTFSDVPAGTAFWFENANGLLEIAVNQGSAAKQLALETGSELRPVRGNSP